MRPSKKTIHIFWLCLIGVTVLAIWGQSLLPADHSQAESDRVAAFLRSLLGDGAFAAFVLTYVRKIAHFTEYFVLGAEWAAFNRLRPSRLSWLYSLPVAAADELLQFLSPGRGPALRDVAIDFAGSLTGFGLLALLLWLHRRRRTAGAQK